MRGIMGFSIGAHIIRTEGSEVRGFISLRIRV